MQVQQGRLDRGNRVDSCAQVARLEPAPTGVAISERGGDDAQETAETRYRLALQQPACFLDGGADRLPSGNLAQPGTAVGIGDNDDVAGEERPVRTREVEQHRVVPGNRDNLDDGDGWLGGHASSPVALMVVPLPSPSVAGTTVPSIRRFSCHGLPSWIAAGRSTSGMFW